MKITEAEKIIKMLRNGKSLKLGHYSAGYETFYYNAETSKFMCKREDMGLDMYNPDISESEFSKKEIMDFLVKGYEYKAALGFLY
ncbi:MAG: hypothetical protein QMC67_14915 [Candidatus Wallbacteria bacterium]